MAVPNYPLAASRPPDTAAISPATMRAIGRLPELVALARELAGRLDLDCNDVSHQNLRSCLRCGPVVAARQLIEYIDNGDGGGE